MNTNTILREHRDALAGFTSPWQGDEIDANGKRVFASPRKLPRLDRSAAISLVDTVRRAMPGVDAVTGLRAVRTLATLRNHPEREAAIARGLSIPSDGYLAHWSPVPDAYGANKHTMRTDGTVARRGMARVQGDLPGRSDDGCLVSVDLAYRLCKDLPRNAVGAASLDVLRLTDVLYPEHLSGVPHLIGTDAVAWRQVVHAAPDADPFTARGVVGAHAAVCTLQTWRARYKLGAVKARKSEHATARALAAPSDRVAVRETITRHETIAHPVHYGRGVWNPALTRWTAPAAMPARTGERETIRETVATAPAQTIWIGHKLKPRGVRVHDTRGGKRAARTLPGIIAGTPDALDHAIAQMNRGDRLIAAVGDLRVTITRAPSAGTFGVKRGDAKTVSGIRTVAAAVRTALALTA